MDKNQKKYIYKAISDINIFLNFNRVLEMQSSVESISSTTRNLVERQFNIKIDPDEILGLTKLLNDMEFLPMSVDWEYPALSQLAGIPKSLPTRTLDRNLALERLLEDDEVKAKLDLELHQKAINNIPRSLKNIRNYLVYRAKDKRPIPPAAAEAIKVEIDQFTDLPNGIFD